MPTHGKLKRDPTRADHRRAQHFVECDDCETGPAQFYCKSCQGNLCEECKVQHETRRLTQGHEVLPLSEYIKSQSDYHDLGGNGTQSGGRRIKGQLKKERFKIENEWLPALRYRRDDECEKKATLSCKVSNIKVQLENRCDMIITMITEIKESYVKKLEKNEENISDEIDQTISNLQRNIEKLEKRITEITQHLDLKNKDVNETMIEEIDEEKLFPKPLSIVAGDFDPSPLEKEKVEGIFGNLPVIVLK